MSLLSFIGLILLFILIIILIIMCIGCLVRRKNRRKAIRDGEDVERKNFSKYGTEGGGAGGRGGADGDLDPKDLDDSLGGKKKFGFGRGRRKVDTSNLKKRGGTLKYAVQEIQLDIVYLDNQNEIAVVVRKGKNFSPSDTYMIRVLVSKWTEKGKKMWELAEQTRAVTGTMNPQWNEHLSFCEISADDLHSVQIEVLGLKRINEKKAVKEIGFVLLSADTNHDTGHKQWYQMVEEEGIASYWHLFAIKK